MTVKNDKSEEGQIKKGAGFTSLDVKKLVKTSTITAD
jgi:hypothetical protein